jgi:toxin ParE1/3/4
VATVVFLASARRDLKSIASYISRESANAAVGKNFAARLVAHCNRIGALPSLMGRDRSDLLTGLRSSTFGNYIVLFQYVDEDGPRSHLHVVNVLHGRRDLEAFYADVEDNDGDDDTE